MYQLFAIADGGGCGEREAGDAGEAVAGPRADVGVVDAEVDPVTSEVCLQIIQKDVHHKRNNNNNNNNNNDNNDDSDNNDNDDNNNKRRTLWLECKTMNHIRTLKQG